jgi:hypothetical protein
MKKITAMFLAGLFCAALSSTASAQDRYDRYERYPPPPPPRAAVAPPPRHAVHGQPYFFTHVGLFEPNDSTNGLDGYDAGGSFDVGIGSRVSPILALEGAVGGYDTTFGGYGSIGVDAWLNPRIALNIEGKYHWAEPSFTSVFGEEFDVKVGGWAVNLGIRVAF